jgi:hypothetical protein
MELGTGMLPKFDLSLIGPNWPLLDTTEMSADATMVNGEPNVPLP